MDNEQNTASSGFSLPELLRKMIEMRGSDLHLTTNNPPRVRVHGHLSALDGYRNLTPADTKQLAYSVLTDCAKTPLRGKSGARFFFRP